MQKALQLFPDPANVSGQTYYDTARLAAQAGHSCEAATIMRDYIAYDALNRRTQQISTMLKDWQRQGSCPYEFAALGFYMSAHPLDNYRAILERIGAVAAGQVASKQRVGGGGRVKIAGIVVSKQERTSKQGNKFAFLSLSDGSGAFEVTVFSELLAAKRDIMAAGQALLVEVDVQTNTQGGGRGAVAVARSAEQSRPNNEGASDLRFIARNIEPLADAAARAARGIRIKLYESTPVADIQKLLAATPKGRAQVVLALDLDSGEEAEIELPGAWQLTEATKAALRQLGDGLDVFEY